jgi:hypothetical protein
LKIRKTSAVRLSGAFILAMTVTGPAASASAGTVAPTPSPESRSAATEDPYFGSILDWSGDSVADQSERLGSPSAVYEHDASFPLTATDQTYLSQYFQQLDAAGSLAVISVKPTVPLNEITDQQAQQFAEQLDEVGYQSGEPLWVRFAPDMNANWVTWGQDPDAYRAAFQTVADAVHERIPDAVMVWTPVWGGDYPFTARAPTTSSTADLDTNGDAMLDGADDPYAPYYPGDAAVDWVGLTLYHDQTAGAGAVNTIPDADEFLEKLGPPETGSPGDDETNTFYARYAVDRDKPFLLETAAFYAPSVGGPGELAVKQRWWSQVFDAVSSGDYPRIELVTWRDTTATRAVVGESVIDWSVTLDPAIAAAFSADLDATGLRLGPVRDPDTAAAAGAASAAGLSLTGAAAWAVVAAVLVLASTLFVLAHRSKSVRRLAYEGPGSRDQRIDMLRGLAIVFVVVNHVGLVSLFQDVSQEFIGVVSGAELFVLLSGTVLGLVYRPKLVSGGIGEVVIRTGRRAWKLYYTALGVVLIIFVLTLIPGIDGEYVTTFTDQGTGGAGSGASGRIYDLYGGVDQLLSYPVNPSIVIDLALLRLGPWQFNVMGLYVILLLVSPLVLWMLSRRWWPYVLGGSAALYVVGNLTRFRLLPSQFEDSFPLLVWQLLFTLGITSGFYRREILAWFRGRTGRIVLGIVIVVMVLLMLFSWNNPYVSSSADFRLGLIPDNAYRPIYATLFERTYLDIGRLVNVIVVVIAAYAVLTAYWRPINKTLGWFLVPLGQATLYVFIMHVFFALIASNIPLLGEGNIWINTVANIVILALLWVMVKRKFLFRIVPR